MRDREAKKAYLRKLFNQTEARQEASQGLAECPIDEIDDLDSYLAGLIESGELEFPMNENVIYVLEEVAKAEELRPELLVRLRETMREATANKERAGTAGSFGATVQVSRDKLGLSMEEVAQHVGILSSYMAEIETDRVSPIQVAIDHMVKLCLVLKLSRKGVLDLVRSQLTVSADLGYAGAPLTRLDKYVTPQERAESLTISEEELKKRIKDRIEKYVLDLDKSLEREGIK
ncbi:XRE family transcriptional regulator [Candidatus Aerophobetes bacterium]|uniref:XRE family transcriptional regulator n=1 Tax=Aerophobetes bacterium TaxID=2030807 RepID=A0A523QH74_UNCAE|nr:MAG: XRE family transcriptional regulator [Candidatus Aerophobetes bacterium]